MYELSTETFCYASVLLVAVRIPSPRYGIANCYSSYSQCMIIAAVVVVVVVVLLSSSSSCSY